MTTTEKVIHRLGDKELAENLAKYEAQVPNRSGDMLYEHTLNALRCEAKARGLK